MARLKVDTMTPMPTSSSSNIPSIRAAILLNKVTRTRTLSSKLATAHQLKAVSSMARLQLHIKTRTRRANAIINNTLLHHQQTNSHSRELINRTKLPTTLTTPAHTAKLPQPVVMAQRTPTRKQKATVA